MKLLLSSIVFLFASTGFAAEEAINLDMKLRIDGKLVSQPRVVSLSGKRASIESVSKEGDGFSIEVTPTLKDKNQIHMKFVVAKLEKDKRSILSEPQMVSLLGQQAEISEASTDEPPKTMSLTVTPTLKDPADYDAVK